MNIPRYTSDGKLFPNSNFKNDIYYKSFNLTDAKKVNNDVYINAIRKVNNSKTALLKQGYCYIKNIFLEYWEPFKQKYAHQLTRPAVVKNVEKMIDCENFENGFLTFKCENGCEEYYRSFTCKSRFCPKCGKKYRDMRTVKVANKLIKAPHRQFVFTIPKEYRRLFRQYRSLLGILFATVNDTFNFILGNNKGIAKKEDRKLGFISFLHTYGRDMKWNPHLHVLIAERYMNNKNEVKKFSYFPFKKIRKVYMFKLMTNVYNHLKKIDGISNKELRNLYYTNKYLNSKYTKGFYIFGPRLENQSISSIKAITKYIARYASHPAISERRITNIDYSNNTVTWFYDPHEDDDILDEVLKKGRQYITEPVFEFMKRLIIHIPDDGFQTIRYYGFYSNKTKIKRPSNLFTVSQLEQMFQDNYWINGLLKSFGYNPLICNVCGSIMVLSLEDSFIPLKGGSPP